MILLRFIYTEMNYEIAQKYQKSSFADAKMRKIFSFSAEIKIKDEMMRTIFLLLLLLIVVINNGNVIRTKRADGSDTGKTVKSEKLLITISRHT